jgi:hypothetical protein
MALYEGRDELERSSHLLTVKLSNGRPVDLVDLTTSLSALAQDFEDFSNKNSQDPMPDNLRLYVREMRSGSIIADLMPLGDQISWIVDHKDLLGAFVGHLNDLAQYFLWRRCRQPAQPTGRRAVFANT